MPLVRLANALRELKGQDLEEGASTRLARLLRQPDRRRHEASGRAIRAAMIEPLTDEPDVKQGLLRVAEIALG